MAYHDPRQPSKEELARINGGYYLKNGELYSCRGYTTKPIGGNDGRGYKKLNIVINKRKYSYLTHHVKWYLEHGVWPSSMIDHSDINSGNDSVSNLRESNNSHNAINRAYKVSGLPPGVWQHKKTGLYVAQMRINRKNVLTKYFKNVENAAQAYRDKYKEIYGKELVL